MKYKKTLTTILILLTILPFTLAVNVGTGISPIIETEDFEPLIWMCERNVLDDATEPGRISQDGRFLRERISNYAFEGEQILWRVLVMDKNGIDKVNDVYVAIGQGVSINITVERQTTSCDSMPLTSTDWSDTLRVDKFDSTLGTLLNAELTIFGQITSGAAVENNDTSNVTITVSVTGEINATLPDGTQINPNIIINDRLFNATSFDGTLNFNGTSGTTFLDANENDTQVTNLTNLTEVTGADTLNISVSAAAISIATGGGNIISQLTTSAEAEACVTYTYETTRILPGGDTIEANCGRADPSIHECRGTPETNSCRTFDGDETRCERIPGCIYRGGSAECRRTPTSCDAIPNANLCNRIAGCEQFDVRECNPRILEERITRFDPDLMGVYDCTFTVETPASMYGEYFVSAQVEDLDGLVGIFDEIEYWFFNPVIALLLDGDLIFDDVRPGTTSYSSTLLVQNDADFGSGVLLDLFISGTDFFDSSSSAARCPDSNTLLLENFRYFATNGAYSSFDDAEVGRAAGNGPTSNRDIDAEGYVDIGYGIGFNDPHPFYDGYEVLQAGPRLIAGPYYGANVLAPGAEMAVTFKLSLPEPCNGDFDTGSLFFWAEAI